jgi:hypothetical protein
LAFSFRISPSSISIILREVLRAISKRFGPIHLPRPTESTWIKNEEMFRTKWNFPNALGAVDGKHVRINAPPQAGSQFYNYKGYHSIVLMAVAGPNYEFSAVDIGASGSQSDGGVFAKSGIGKALDNKTLGFPKPKIVGKEMLPHVLLADDAFPLKDNIMKPYPGKFLEVSQRIYNYRLSRARMVVENSFGLLAARWRIFGTAILADMDLVKSIVETSCILHNFLLSKNDFNSITVDSEVNGEFVEGNWRNVTGGDIGFVQINQQGSNNFKLSASEVRNKFKTYFSSKEGEVIWQNDRI